MVVLATVDVDWAAAQSAVAKTGARVTALLRSARYPEAPALGTWNLTDVAAHLSHAVDAISAMSKGGGFLLDDIWGLSILTEGMVAGESTRDLSAFADRIDATVAEFLASMESAAEDGSCCWLVNGVEFPLSALTCHMLNELTVHGRDIALAEGAPWPIERAHAALILCGFVFRAMGSLGRALVDQEEAAGLRLCYHLKVRGGCDVYLRFEDGELSVDDKPWKAVDCHLSVDPVAFMLVGWGRINQWRAIAKGQLLAWGRRPWLGLKLRALLKNV